MHDFGDLGHMSDLRPANGGYYQLRKWVSIGLSAFSYVFVYFHRFSTAVLADSMAEDFRVDKARLAIFTSMYFWPYGLMQPIIGSLGDLIEPGYLIGIANVISGCGALICSFSSNLALSCFARFLVGMGCSGIFVSTNKIGSNWFTDHQFMFFSGALIGVGGIGSLSSQYPLHFLDTLIGWRMCFLLVGIISLVVGFLAFLFVRGHPKTLGFSSPYPLPMRTAAKEVFRGLFQNWGEMIRIGQFWVLALYMFLTAGAFMNLSSYFGVPYLTDVAKLSKSTASLVQMALSIATIIGSPLLPVLADRIQSRTIVLFLCALFTLGIASFLAVWRGDMNPWVIAVLFFFFGLGANCCQGVALPVFKEMGRHELSATLVGGGNTGPFIGGAMLQVVTSSILRGFPTVDGSYDADGYGYGLWGLSMFCGGVSCLLTFFMREPKRSGGKGSDGTLSPLLDGGLTLESKLG
jgi:MFS family permease